MYAEYWGHFGLQRNPFPVSPNRGNFYSTAAHDEALLQLVSRIEMRQGLMVLTGEAGTGKTTVLQYLLDWLQQYGYSTAYVFHPVHPFTELLQLIVAEFGIPCVSVSKSELLGVFRNWLIDRHQRGDCPVILIDEAQALTSRTLLQLRALLNLELQGARLVQVVLAGQPRFEEKLARRKLSRFRQRIMCHCTLRPLTWAETCGYIASRLRAAGAPESALLSMDSVGEIFCYSKGVPRVINMLSEHALLIAYGQRRKAVHASDVVLAARQFDLVRETDLDVDTVLPTTLSRPAVTAPIPPPEAPAVVTVAESTCEELNELATVVVKELESDEQQEEEVKRLWAAAAPQALPAPIPAMPVTMAPVSSTLTVEPIRLDAQQIITAPPLPTAPPESPAASVRPQATPEPARVPVAHNSAPSLVATWHRCKLARQALQGVWLKFTRYWREVGRSFARDARQFAKQCESWLGRPAEWNLEAASRRIASVSTWLRQPAGTSHVGRKHPPIPSASAAHKQV
jgi:general secretion pathway protein A